MSGGFRQLQPAGSGPLDEAQFLAPRGALSRKPPYWIQAAGDPPPYGVDFIVITEHPQLIDST